MAPPARWLQVSILSFFSVPSFALPHADTRYFDINRRDYISQSHCEPTPLGFVHPYPDATKSTITITKQGQRVTTYIPTGTKCAESTCTDLYSTLTYNWYSTWLPGQYGPQFVTRGDDTITLPPGSCATCGPRHRLQSHYCSKNGIHTVNGRVHRVHDAPRYVYYAEEIGYNYQVSDVNSYFRWLHNKTLGVTFEVEDIHCAGGVCSKKLQTWRKDQKIKKVVKSVTTEFKGYCHQPGPCELSAYIPDYGTIRIVVSVKSKGIATRVSAQELTITRTHVVTRTITRKSTSSTSISSSCTSKKRSQEKKTRPSTISPSRSFNSPATTSSSQSISTPEIGTEFYLALDVNPINVGRKARQQAGKLNPDYFVRFDDGDFTYAKNGWEALPFSLSEGQLTANGGYLKAFINLVNNSSRPESIPVRMGIPGIEDTAATIASFYDGSQHVLIWDARKIPAGTALAQFCIRGGVNGESGQIFIFWDAVAPEDCLLAALFVLNDFRPPFINYTLIGAPVTKLSIIAQPEPELKPTADYFPYFVFDDIINRFFARQFISEYSHGNIIKS